MKTAIVYYSKHHGNTKKLVDAIARENEVTLIDVTEQPSADLSEYDRIGFASGIAFGKYYPQLLAFMEGMSMGKFGLVVFICFITCLLGMVIPGSSRVVIFGPVFITALVAVGVNPVLAAAMLPCICGVMCGITPPLGLGMYAGMSLSGSEFGPTFKNNLWWVAAQFVMEVIVLMDLLPILGLH